MKHQQGLSLVELMVAIVISMLLLLGVLQLFANTSSSDRANTALARVQENGRIALELIAADARRAGFQGCTTSSSPTEIGDVILPDQAIAGDGDEITLRYAVLNDTGAAFPDDDVERTCGSAPETYYLKTVTYGNCNDGSLCMDGKTLLKEAQLLEALYGIADGDNIVWKSNPDDDDLRQAKAIRISLRVSNASQNVSRDFSGTYELRNRRG